MGVFEDSRNGLFHGQNIRGFNRNLMLEMFRHRTVASKVLIARHKIDEDTLSSSNINREGGLTEGFDASLSRPGTTESRDNFRLPIGEGELQAKSTKHCAHARHNTGNFVGKE